MRLPIDGSFAQCGTSPQRAQRLGFSLSDVATLLNAWEAGKLSDAGVLQTAESRYLSLEKRITELLAG